MPRTLGPGGHLVNWYYQTHPEGAWAIVTVAACLPHAVMGTVEHA